MVMLKKITSAIFLLQFMLSSIKKRERYAEIY